MERERIPEYIIKEIINSDNINPRTRALIICQYAIGARIGELVYYNHKILSREARKHKRENPGYIWQESDYEKTITNGLLKINIKENDRAISMILPNFKNKKQTIKAGFILKEQEKWMYEPFKEYLQTIDNEQPLFNFSARWARELVGSRLKKYNPTWSSHNLRHSRATNLIIDLNVPIERAKKLLGHASLESTMVYTHTKTEDVIEAAVKGYREKEGRGG